MRNHVKLEKVLADVRRLAVAMRNEGKTGASLSFQCSGCKWP
jgi:hypothetical protein